MRSFHPNFNLPSNKLGLIIFYNIFLLLLTTTVRAQAPTITSFSPNPVCQGQQVTITGTNFTGATQVQFGNTNAVNFTVNSATSITATVSDQAAGGQITATITTPNGTITSTATLNVLPAPKPVLIDQSTVDGPFTNCDGNATYKLTVSNNSVVTAPGNTYEINWGDNTPVFTQTDWPAAAQVSHTYTTQGYFPLTLTITPANGCAKSAVYQFYNGKNPLASFTTTSSTTGLCAPADVEFQIGNWFNNTPGTTYDIDFGDGTAHAILTHPLEPTNITHLLTHRYNTSSCPSPDFTATLKAINGCFTTTYTLNQIIIRLKPVADFDAPPSPVCINTPVCFTNKTVGGYNGNGCSRISTFLWDFGDNTTSTLEDPPCHTYASPGTYTVKLTAANTGCGASTKTKTVTVSPISPPPTVAAPSPAYCQGQSAAQLTATGTGLLWYTSATGGTGSATAPTPSTNVPGTQTWYVSQTLPAHCESTRVPVTVVVNAIPGAPGVTTPVQLCLNQAATPLTATGTGLLWYTAATGGTGSPTAPTPSTAAVGSTTYFVSQNINSCEGPRAAITVTVNALATAPGVTTPVTYCQNQTAVPLTANGTGLLWYTSAAGGVGSATAPTPSTTTPGSTTWYVSQVTGCGEGPRASITVVVNVSPTAAIAYTPSIFCNINTPPVAVTHTGASGGTYSVSPAGLTIDPNTGAISPTGATAGVYTIRYTIPGTGGCTDYITTATVTVNGAPAATISYPPICTADAATGVALTGSAGGTFTATAGLTINAATGVITPGTSTPGNYTVTYTIAAAAPCPGFVTTAPVTVTRAPSATISYTPAILCNVANTPATPNLPVAVILTGTQGGTYSITPAIGLPIISTSGVINPAGAIAGVYTIRYTVAGTGGCADYSTTTTVTVNNTPTAAISYAGSPYCGSNAVPQPVSLAGTAGGVFSATAGLSINAATGAINPSLSTAGTYTVTYTIAASPPCPGYVTTTTVQIEESPVITFPTPAQSICSGETAVFTPASSVAGTTYTWAVLGPLPANVAGISAGAASGPNAAIALSFTNTGAASQVLTVQVIPTNPAQKPCAGAPYDLLLTVHPATPAPVTDTAHFCMAAPPAALHVNAIPGTTLKWYDQNGGLLNAAPVISTAAPTRFTYYVSQTNSYGCESPRSKIIAIVHPTVKIVSSSFTNPTTCGVPSGSVVLTVKDLNNGAVPNIPVVVHYNKFQLAQTFTGSTDAAGNITIPLTAGTYTNMYVETTGSCNSQKIPDVFILRDPSPPAAPVAGYNPPLCTEMPLTFTALTATSEQAGPIDYVWAGPAFGPYADTVRNTVITFPSATQADAGTYVVYAMQNNCISLPASFEVLIKQSPSKPVITTRTPLCVGDDLVLQASSSIPSNAAINYVWKGPGRGFPVNGPNAGINSVKVEDAGIYTITVTSPETGCSASTDTLIQIGAYPIVKFAQDTLTLPTGYRLPLDPVITNATDPGILPIKTYTWKPLQDLDCNDAACSAPIANIKNDVCYNVTVTNVYGCTGSDELCVKVFCQSSQVFIPNAFAPNGNVPENRKLMVRASGINAVKSFRIFNRWGKMLFERSNFAPNSPDFGWDGRVNGKLADTGVYIYTVEVICENGVPYTFKGNVTLL